MSIVNRNTPAFDRRRVFAVILISVLVLVPFAGPAKLSGSVDQEEKRLHKLIRHTIPLISVEELHDLLEKKNGPILLDTRTEKEYRVSHLKGARLVGENGFNMNSLEDIPRDAQIVVYCSLGVRSEIFGEKLKRAGFKNIRNLEGGIFFWVNRDYTIYNLNGAPTENIHPFNKKWGKWLIKGKKTKTHTQN